MQNHQCCWRVGQQLEGDRTKTEAWRNVAVRSMSWGGWVLEMALPKGCTAKDRMRSAKRNAAAKDMKSWWLLLQPARAVGDKDQPGQNPGYRYISWCKHSFVWFQDGMFSKTMEQMHLVFMTCFLLDQLKVVRGQVEHKVRNKLLLFHLLLEKFNLGRKIRNLHLNLNQSVDWSCFLLIDCLFPTWWDVLTHHQKMAGRLKQASKAIIIRKKTWNCKIK